MFVFDLRLLRRPEVRNAFASNRVDEAMLGDAATTRKRFSEHSEALEAELRVAIAA